MTITICRKVKQEKNLDFAIVYFWQFIINDFVPMRYPIETSPLVCSANQRTGFYMITASVMKGLKSFNLYALTELNKSKGGIG